MTLHKLKTAAGNLTTEILAGKTVILEICGHFRKSAVLLSAGFLKISRFKLKCALGMLFLLSLFSQDNANAQHCNAFTTCIWFEMPHDSGPIFTYLSNSSAPYDRTVHGYHVRTGSGGKSTRLEYVVSERSDNGNWIDSAKTDGTASRSDYSNVSINQAIKLQVPQSSLNRAPVGSWYVTGSNTHNNNIKYTFVPNDNAVDDIQAGHKIEAKIQVSLIWDGNRVRTRELVLTYANFSSMGLTWEANNNPIIVSDGNSTYGEVDGIVDNNPSGVFPMIFGGNEMKPNGLKTSAIVGKTREITSKYDGWDVPVGENFKYGFWVISRNNDKFLFRPNSAEINKLSDKQIVVSVLEVIPHDGNDNPMGEKLSIKVVIGKIGIRVDWGNDLEFDSEGNPIITIDHSSDYEDLHATLDVVKVTGDYYHGGADDYLNGNMKISGSSGPASGDLDAENLPPGFVQGDTRVYGRGWSNGSGKHRGGVWFFDGRRDLVAFRPIKERLDELAAGEFVESYLYLKIVRWIGGHTTLATKTLKVTIKKAGSAKVSINDIELAEGTGSESTEFRFKVSIDSEVPVGESFTVPLAFAHVTTDRFDFPGDTNPTIPDVNFGPGDTEQIVSILVKRDSDKEFGETFTLRLSEPTGDAKNSNLVKLDTELGASVGTGTILDDDKAQISIGDGHDMEGSGSGSTELQFTVSLAPATALNQTFTVPVTFAHLSTDRDDFLSDPTQTNFDVSFGALDTAKTISILVAQDTQGEENERFTLTLSEPTGDAINMNLVTLSSAPRATVGLGTINNDDPKGATSTWASEFEGAIVSDGFSDQYGYKVAVITDNSPLFFGYEVVETKNEKDINRIQFLYFSSRPRADLDLSLYPEFTGSNSSVYEADDNFQYGRWYIRHTNDCGGDSCRHLLFIPNSSEINKLKPGDIVKSTFIYSLYNSSDEVVETSLTTVTITTDFRTNGIGFDVDSRTIETGESESAALEVSLPQGMSGPVTIPFSISDGTAKYPVDFRNPPSSSLTIPNGETRGTISIPIVDDLSHEGDETFTVSLGDGTDFAIAPALQTATVTILDNDSIGTSLPRGRECHDVAQPSTVTTPNTRAYWETPAAKVYYAPHEKIDVRMGFKEMVRIETDFNYGAFFSDGTAENDDLSKAAFANLTGVDFQINRPGNHRGKFQYAILPSSETDNKWYHIDAPCVFHVWWTDGNRPGIALSIEHDSVLEGKSFRVKATATPAPDRNLLIPVFLSDESRIEDSQTYDILIEAGQTSGFKDIHTSFTSGDQTEDEVVASTEWRNSYWLDSSDAVKSDSVTIQDHDKLLVEFKNSNPNVTVSETGNAELVVKYEGTPSQRVTVKYQIGGDDDTADTSDFMEPSVAEITIPATSNEGTIRISISEDTAHEESEFFTVTLIESNDAVPSDRNSVAAVTILSNDRPTEAPPSSSCDAVTQPVGVSNPNTQAYWSPVPNFYQENNDVFARLGFRNPSNPTPADFRIGIYNIDGTVVDNNVSLTSVANTDHLDFTLTRPADNKRYKYYRILESNHSDNRWYSIGTPCDFHIWWVDENLPGITLTVDEESIVEGESATVSATAIPEPSQDLLVPFSISDVSRIEDSQEYSILIRAGQSFGQTELLTKSLPGDQATDELTVTAEWQSSYLLDEGAASDVISIVEETGVALISINDVTHEEDDDSGSIEFQFKVSLSPATAVGQSFTVPVAFNHVSTDEFDFATGQDFSNLDVTFGTGDTEKTIQIFVNDDEDKEPDETFTLTLSEPTGDAKTMNLVTLSSVQDETVGTGTITNDDPATLSIASVTMDEDNETGGNRFLFAVSLSPAVALGQTFTVPITFSDVSTDDDDFVANQNLNSLSATFGIADTERMVPVVVELDYENEPDETFTLTLGEPTGDAKNMNLVTLSGVQNGTVATGTIVNNDQTTISIDNVTKAEGTGSENTTFEFTVSLSPAEALSQDFSVPLTFKHVSTDPTDFVDGSLAAIPASADFAAADAKTEYKIEITVKADDMGESDETFTLTLSEPTGAAKDMNLVKLSATASVGTGTITTDDGTVVTIESLSIEENSGTGGSTLFRFNISLVPAVALSQEFSVPVAFRHGTTNDGDFAENSLAAIPSSVEIAAGKTSVAIDILVGWDDDNEGDETFTLTISEPTGPAKEMDLVTLNSTPGGNVGTGTIVDDDAPVVTAGNLTIDIPAVVYAFENFGSAAITMSLSSLPATAIKMRATTIEITDTTVAANLKAEAGTDFTGFSDREFDILTTQSIATLTVDILADTAPEQNESFLVAISTTSGATITGADNTGARIVKVVIIDDDQYPTVEVVAVSQSITEGEDAVFEIEANFHGKPSEDILVHYQVTQTGDYLFSPVSGKIAVNSATKMLKMPTVDDNADGNGGAVTLTLLEGDGYGYRPHPGKIAATVTITDNDNGSVKSPETLYSVVSAVITEILQSTGPTESTDSKREPSRVTVSLFAVEKTAKEGDPIRIAVTVTGENHSGINVRIGLRETGDFVDEGTPVIVSIPPESNTTVHEIPTVDDDLSEADGIVTALIRESDEYSLGDPATVEIKVTDEADRLARRDQMSAAQLAMLPEITGSIGARSLEAMSVRLAQAFSDTTGPQLELGGGSTLQEMLTSGARSFDQEDVSWEEILGDSSFNFDLLPESEGTSVASVWGLGDFRNISSGDSSTADAPDGNVFTGHIGFDTRIGEGIVTGITTSMSNADSSFGQGNGLIQFKTRTTGLHPYVGLRSADGDDRLDIITGYGLGEVGMDQVRYSSETLQSSFYNAGLNGSVRLYSNEEFLDGASRINATGSSWLARQFLKNGGGFVEGSRTKTVHARLAVEGNQEYELAGGGKLHAESRLGIGADEKGERSFVGMLLETGVSYQNPLGLNVQGDSVLVAANGGQVRELELAGGLDFDYGRDERGLLLNFAPAWGRTFSESDGPLWNSQLLSSSSEMEIEGTGRKIESEVGYGLQLVEEIGLLTPYADMLMSDENNRYSLGIRLNHYNDFDFRLEGVRQSGRESAAEGIFKLNGNVRW